MPLGPRPKNDPLPLKYVKINKCMTVAEYISQQEENRKNILSSIHFIIIKEDQTVIAEVGKMMGKEMILYKEKGHFKYGLASVKNYMSMHIMPIYGGSPLHAKYKILMPDMEFQKGCINFKSDKGVPFEIIRQLFADCARISIVAMMDRWAKAKKT
jgi:hypothetical protein